MQRSLHDHPPARRIGRVIALLVMLIGFVTVASPLTSAHASRNVSAMKTVCAVHDVHVSPTKPAAIRCLKTVQTVNGIVSNSVSEDRCQGEYPAVTYELAIVSYSRGVWCFWGDGYAGLGLESNTINDATQIESLSWSGVGGATECGSGWVMYYFYPWSPGTGHKFYFGECQTYNSSNSVFGPTIKVSQVDLNGY